VLPLKDDTASNFLTTRANKMRVKQAMTCPKTLPVVACMPSLPEATSANTLSDNNLMGK
jgi:hypothetical protein